LLDSTPQADRRQRGLERFIRGYLVVILFIAAAAFACWLWSGAGAMRSLQVLTSILVVSCPCASGVALPLAEELATARARRAGVLVREQSLWARLPRVDTIVFDKTGTLTLETLALLNPEGLAQLGKSERGILLDMVCDNLHPAASCLREHLLAGYSRDAASGEATPPTEHIGLGIELGRYRLGRPGWAGEADGDCIFSRDGAVLAAFRFGDELREDAPDEFRELTAHGFTLRILSGDRPGKVAAMAQRLGVPPGHAHGALSPDAKAAWLHQLGTQRTLMIGDGANDSLAFNSSLCTGTPAIDRGLLERKADFYFLGRGLSGIRALLAIAQRRRTAARAVVTFAIAYNAAAIALSIAGKMSPLLAALLMPLSSLATIAIVLALLRRR
jgi:Cu2+-exporting ATPase